MESPRILELERQQALQRLQEDGNGSGPRYRNRKRLTLAQDDGFQPALDDNSQPSRDNSFQPAWVGNSGIHQDGLEEVVQAEFELTLTKEFYNLVNVDWTNTHKDGMRSRQEKALAETIEDQSNCIPILVD